MTSVGQSPTLALRDSMDGEKLGTPRSLGGSWGRTWGDTPGGVSKGFQDACSPATLYSPSCLEERKRLGLQWRPLNFFCDEPNCFCSGTES